MTSSLLDRYFQSLAERLETVRSTQAEAIARAAEHSADSIAVGKLVFTFGTGHGALPALETFHQQHGEQVPILGVDYLDVVPGVAMDLVEETGATYPLVADPGGDLGVGSDVRVVGLPHFVLIDAEGRVVHQSPGGIDSVAELEQMVTEHLGVTL